MRRKLSERTSSILFIVVVVCLLAIAVVLAFQPFPSSAALSHSLQQEEATTPEPAADLF